MVVAAVLLQGEAADVEGIVVEVHKCSLHQPFNIVFGELGHDGITSVAYFQSFLVFTLHTLRRTGKIPMSEISLATLYLQNVEEDRLLQR